MFGGSGAAPFPFLRAGLAFLLGLSAVSCAPEAHDAAFSRTAAVPFGMPLQHDFLAGGYSVLQGGWNAIDPRTGKEVRNAALGGGHLLTFDMNRKEISTYRSARMPEVIDGTSGNRFAAFLALFLYGVKYMHWLQGRLEKVAGTLTVVTNRQRFWVGGEAWHRFVQGCGGYDNPTVGFVWMDASPKMCVRVLKNIPRARLQLRAQWTVPAAHGSSATITRESPWVVFSK